MANNNRRSLPSLPSLPSAGRARRLSSCFCGCGGVTGGTFVPGHDSTLKAWVMRVEKGIVAIDGEELEEFPKLRARIEQIVNLRATGKNVTFMRNVELPTRVEETLSEDVDTDETDIEEAV